MRNTLASQDIDSRHPKYFEVEQERPAPQILAVELHFPGNGQIVAAVDLSPACQTWNQLIHAGGGTRLDEIVLVK